MPKLVKRLEQALQVWESTCFLFSLMVQMKSKVSGSSVLLQGPLAHWAEYRDYLLSLKPLEIQMLQEDRFSFSAEAENVLGPVSGVPFDLACWTIGSRRVYHLSRELSLLLLATSLKDIKWSDFTLPFSSFAITLEEPIFNPQGKSFDCILFGLGTEKISRERIVTLNLLCTDLDLYVPIGAERRTKLLQDLKKGRQDRLTRVLDQEFKQEGRLYFSRAFFLPEAVDANITDSITALYNKTVSHMRVPGHKYRPEQYPEWDTAMRVICGLCLYLSTLPSRSTHRSDWMKVDKAERKSNPRAITKQSEVCYVSSTIRIQDSEVGILAESNRRGFLEVSAHFVQGHWRRPPGEGQNPMAKKTVWVHPYFVHKDKLEQGQLPGGAETIIH